MTTSVGAIQPTGQFRYMGTPSIPSLGIGLYDNYCFQNSTYPLTGVMGTGNLFNYNMGMMPFAGGTSSIDNSQYFDNMRQYQQFYNDYYINQQSMYRNQQYQINAPMNSVQQSARNLKDKINQNEQDQIPEAFKAYVETVAQAYGGDVNDRNTINQALALYTQMNGGITLEQDLRLAGHGSFLQGIISGLTFGLYGNKSAEDNISEITGQPVGTDENIKKKAGGALGGAATGAAVGAAIGACFGGIGAGPGAIGGAIIGGIAGLFTA